jgi:predicted O-linked N-acetylglucosamine transferase (SPINDLY family)
MAYEKQGEIDAALASFRAALEINPNYASAHANLGVVLHLCGDDDSAFEHFRRALDLDPNHAGARHNMGSVLLKQGDLDQAIACFLDVLRVAPSYADAALNLGMAYQALGRIDEAKTSLRQAMDLACGTPVARLAHDNLLLVESGCAARSAADYLEEARRFGANALAGVTPYLEWQPSPAGRPLRVGFVSGDLRTHPVGFFLEGVLAHVDTRHFSLIAYSTTREEDALTARLRPRFAEWHVIASTSDEAAARRIPEDEIDILVDLAGHTAGNRLAVFAWKPAPVQVSWLGYWASTGVTGMDYFLADPISVPAGSETDFTESIWRLPETRFCFTPPTSTAELAVRPPPALVEGYVTFASYQNLAKLTDATLALWGRIMHAMPDARVRLQDKYLGYPAARDFLQRRLSAAGIAPERVAMYGRVARNNYLATYADVDFVLDTFPFCGGTTTCEALWMGVPTLTLAGPTLVSRQGASLLTCVGMQDWIAGDEEAYVEKALRFASDVKGLSDLRATLRQRALDSPLFDAERFARNLEAALRGMSCAMARPHLATGGP